VRVLRGGSWSSGPALTSAAGRDRHTPTARDGYSGYGFRVVRAARTF